jgi:ADP-ribosylglycohydrolase
MHCESHSKEHCKDHFVRATLTGDLAFDCAAGCGALDPSYYVELYRVFEPLHIAKHFKPHPARFQGLTKFDIECKNDAYKDVKVKFDELVTKCSEDKRLDKILGCIYGNALGDAFGLSTEFLIKSQVEKMYPDRTIPFPDYQKNQHNQRWKSGDWTDDTDQMILIMQMFMQNIAEEDNKKIMKVNILDYAAKLRSWIQKGFPELGDFGGMGLGATVAKVVSDSSFLTHPLQVSEETWVKSGRVLAANGAVMRTSIVGLANYWDLEQVRANSEVLCKVTHFDPRCVASCFMVTRLIAQMIQSAEKEVDPEAMIKEALEIAERDILSTPEHQKAFNLHVMFDNLSELELDDRPVIGYTLKTLGAGIYGFRSTKSFKETMLDITWEAGDADTNGAVAGALLGVKVGYKNLPEDWLSAFPFKPWLDRLVLEFIEKLESCKTS